MSGDGRAGCRPRVPTTRHLGALTARCESCFDPIFDWLWFATGYRVDARGVRGRIKLRARIIAGVDDCHAREPGTGACETRRHVG